eukprot:CAMPEP_0202732268 /NCGR_PEP_ID=MMETSP1385-20130828/187561_1 /ASSEMBLY_ACC=CAM_ASM_000861 /TAXON_ID=933848 /ORGANISM="Elphidium margaritaceum" /LENGTH=853 /DNA_ID=CAMNT_0049398575 /DNA_START=59 /DNA_END=2618 /DNA_ORIENTATION=+
MSGGSLTTHPASPPMSNTTFASLSGRCSDLKYGSKPVNNLHIELANPAVQIQPQPQHIACTHDAEQKEPESVPLNGQIMHSNVNYSEYFKAASDDDCTPEMENPTCSAGLTLLTSRSSQTSNTKIENDHQLLHEQGYILLGKVGEALQGEILDAKDMSNDDCPVTVKKTNKKLYTKRISVQQFNHPSSQSSNVEYNISTDRCSDLKYESKPVNSDLANPAVQIQHQPQHDAYTHDAEQKEQESVPMNGLIMNSSVNYSDYFQAASDAECCTPETENQTLKQTSKSSAGLTLLTSRSPSSQMSKTKIENDHRLLHEQGYILLDKVGEALQGEILGAKDMALTSRSPSSQMSKTKIENDHRLLHEQGYILLDKVGEALQGEILGAKDMANDDCPVMVKKTDKKLYTKRISVQQEMNVVVEEDICKEAVILHHLTTDHKPVCNAIVKFIQFFESDSAFYLVTERAGDQSLQTLAETAHEHIANGRLKIKMWRKSVKYIFFQIAAALYWLHHDMHCCHLRLCLSSIMVSNGNFIPNAKDEFLEVNPNISVKIVDFGVSEIFKCTQIEDGISIERPLAQSNDDQKQSSEHDDEGAFYLVTERAGDQSLQTLAETAHEHIANGRLKLKSWRKSVKYIFWQIATVLYWLHHDMHCCHLRLCLSGIMVSNGNFIPNAEDGSGFLAVDPNISVKIIDFGVSEVFKCTKIDHGISIESSHAQSDHDQKQNSEHDDEGADDDDDDDDDEYKGNDFTCSKHAIGYKDYLLPPKIFMEEAYDARKADIWSMGVILYELATGVKPCASCSPFDAQFKQLKEHNLLQVIQQQQHSKYFNMKMVTLLCDLLAVDEQKRLSISDILKHDW